MADNEKAENLSSVISHPLSIVFMGTPTFALPVIEAIQSSKHKIIAVYTQPPRPSGRGQKETPSPVHQFALEHNLPVYTPTSLKSVEEQSKFAAHKADIAVVIAYGLLLPKAILEAYPHGCINVHPSLLPRWRGAAPIQRTIMAGDKKTAIIIMKMDEGLDTGDMLLTEHIDIPDATNAGELHDLLSGKAAPLIMKVLDEINSLTSQKQSEIGVTYAKKISKEDCIIDWKKPAQEIYQQILGLSPAQGACFSYNNEIIKIFDAIVEKTTTTATAGTIIDDKLGIACGNGILRPLILQRPNKKRMSADELLHGFNIPVRTILV
ncbi:MAG: methionyl-tRNA formyltransferase [Pseudomonadota bacterium]